MELARTAMNATIMSPSTVPGGTLTAMLATAVEGALVLTARKVGGRGVPVGVAVGESVGTAVDVGVEAEVAVDVDVGVAKELGVEEGVLVAGAVALGLGDAVTVGVGLDEGPLPKAATAPCQLELAERVTPVPKLPEVLAFAYR